MSDFDTLSADLDAIKDRDTQLIAEIASLHSQLSVLQSSVPVDLSPLVDKAASILALAQAGAAAPTPGDGSTQQFVGNTTSGDTGNVGVAVTGTTDATSAPTTSDSATSATSGTDAQTSSAPNADVSTSADVNANAPVDASASDGAVNQTDAGTSLPTS